MTSSMRWARAGARRGCPHLGVAADAAAQQGGVPARVLLDVGEGGVDADVQALERRKRGVGLGALAQLVAGLADDGHVEVASRPSRVRGGEAMTR
jgi:hypothetical protein